MIPKNYSVLGTLYSVKNLKEENDKKKTEHTEAGLLILAVHL